MATRSGRPTRSHPGLKAVADALERIYQVPLVGPGLNYYRDGRDSVAFHGDRELRPLSATIVAILTLGAAQAVPVAAGRWRDGPWICGPPPVTSW